MEDEHEDKKNDSEFSICKVSDFSSFDFNKEFFFIGKTDEENSLVCITQNVPESALFRDDGWKAFRNEALKALSDAGYEII